jgi:hypothetical protein
MLSGKRERYDLAIRESDGKCRAVRNGKPLTGWCGDALKVFDIMSRKDRPHAA